MHIVIRNLVAVVLGFVVGSAVNMALVTVGPMIIAPPEGVNSTNMESLAASMHLFSPRHFLFPFMAHALGTFTGAVGAYLLAVSQPAVMSYVVGTLFLFGGIAVATMLPSPIWFVCLDLLLAYIPMAMLAVLLARKLKQA